ncbi:FAR-RED impaired response 1-like protein [Tanacetum coccineum]
MGCLRSVMDGYMLPRVIVIDRELALMKAYDTAFPNAKGLLCRWHIILGFNTIRFADSRKDGFMNQKPRRHAYIDKFLNMFHPYIEEVRDVRADGNYGFRAIVFVLKLHENEWHIIRYDLMEELRIYYDQFVVMFGTQECDNVKKRLNIFKNGFAPKEKWMSIPKIGFLIASPYNAIFHNITTIGSMTYVPLHSSPPLTVDDDIHITHPSEMLDDDDPWIRTTDFTLSGAIGRCNTYRVKKCDDIGGNEQIYWVHG